MQYDLFVGGNTNFASDVLDWSFKWKDIFKTVHIELIAHIGWTLDLFANPVGCRPSLAKCCAFCVFKRKLAEPSQGLAIKPSLGSACGN
ncbi:MAG: hypothetical protein LBC53_09595 [Spirochaetaceae bacterium]|jgi:hypothetical protein|nr:hypothetical protein [Spirochaetaceae bacterium]